jgi:hypothetical protein
LGRNDPSDWFDWKNILRNFFGKPFGQISHKFPPAFLMTGPRWGKSTCQFWHNEVDCGIDTVG